MIRIAAISIFALSASAWGQDTSFNQLSARPITPEKIELQWQALADYSEDYVIKRVEVGTNGGWRVIKRVGPDVQTFIDSTVKPDTRYCYVIDRFYWLDTLLSDRWIQVTLTNAALVRTPRKATDTPGREILRALLKGSKVPMPWVPAAPKLTATRDASGSVRLAWQADVQGEFGFVIERRVTGRGSWHRLALVPADSTSAEDSSATGRSNFEYRVRAYYWSNASAAGRFSNVVVVRPK